MRVATLVLSPLLVAQALRTRQRLPRLPEAEGPREGVVGQGERLDLLIVGDSSAAGVGVDHQRQALAGRLSDALAAQALRRVHWRLRARSGVTSAGAFELIEGDDAPADVAVVVLGVNDVVDRVPPVQAMQARARLVERLRRQQRARHVVFTALPPVHRFPGLPQPLRWAAGAEAQRHNEALARWAGAQGHDVSMAPMPIALDTSTMAVDGFHPGATVYAAVAARLTEHLLPRLRAAV